MLPHVYIVTHVLDVILATYLCWGLESLLRCELVSDDELWLLNNGPGTLGDLLY